MALNTTGLYKVVLKGRYSNQNIINILYYRLGIDFVPGDFNLAGADTLAALVRDQVWTGGMRGRMNNNYLLDKIEVYPMDVTFELLYQLPYTLEVGEYGMAGASPTNGPTSCAIVKFNLEPTTPLVNGFVAPKRGYIALGPLADSFVDNSGYLENADYNAWSTAVQVFAENLESVLPPVVFFPIRIHRKTDPILGVTQGWADVQSCTINHRASFRRSRLPEAA